RWAATLLGQKVGQWVAAPRIRIALAEGVIVGVEKYHPEINAFCSHVVDDGGQVVQITDGTHVNGDGDTLHPLIACVGDKFLQETHGQVVNTDVTGVFQQVQRNGFA